MSCREKMLVILALLLLALSALSLTVLPGIRFTGALAAALAALCGGDIALGRWAGHSRAGRAARRGFHALLAAGMLLFGVLEGLVMFHGGADHDALPADAVIVLGAGVNGETPSLILQSRIDAAAAYLKRHPAVPAVLSGGQGPGEDITEAEAMRRGLTALGVAERRLLLEEESTSTAENFARSKALLADWGVDAETGCIAVVTSDFHCFRAHLIAQRAGLTVLDVPAEIPWRLLEFNYTVREAFALVKTLIFD